MSSSVAPQLTIEVGVLVERSKGASRWADVIWRPTGILTGVPDTPAWSKLSDDGERATFYAGVAEIALYRSEAGNYRENLLVEAPLLWVVLHPAVGDPPFGPPTVTADPAEGEAWAGTPEVTVDSVPMPDTIREQVAAFVAEHHVEQAFSKRKRDRADPEALARRAPQGHGQKP